MISKNKLKELAAYRLQKRCDEEAVFVVEGPKMASEALASDFLIQTLCATPEWITSNPIPEQTEVFEVSPTELERLSNFKTPNQVWMLVERKQPQTLTSSTLTLALDKIQDPGNLGTLMRTADWFGIRHIVCSNDTVSCYNPKVVQSTMGAIFRTHIEYTNLPVWLKSCGMPVYGASLQGRPLLDVPHPLGETVLLIGNESRGISPEAMTSVTHPVLIPNVGGTAESLNASVAAGILIHALTS